MFELSSYNHGFITKENFYKLHSKIRSSLFCVKRGVLRNFAKFTGKHIHRKTEHIFSKVPGLRPSKKFLRTPFLQNTSRRLLLKNTTRLVKTCFRRKESFIVSLFFVSAEKWYSSSRSEVFGLKDFRKNFA